MKLKTLTALRYCNEKIELRLAEIASDTRIGLMDSTVPIEALVNGVTYPRYAMPICS